jgi:calcineurin-like phosphoesterase family protein
MSDRKVVFFTSDWHVGHANSLVFDKRPFRDLNHMHEVLINNYNSTVPEDGICYFLGDVGLSSSDATKKVISRLNGTKVLILGNHDKGHSAMYAMGFDVVLNAATLYIAGRRVTLSHCPLRGVFREDITGMKNAKDGDNWHGEHKNGPYTVTDEGQFHLHGHIHSGPANKKLKIDGRQFDVGVCANNYRPVSISAIESWIALTDKKESR